MSALLPCPFCGGEAKALQRFPGYALPWMITASHDRECFISSWEGYLYETEGVAIAAWNTRNLPANPLSSALAANSAPPGI